jgi:hypothetical protein
MNVNPCGKKFFPTIHEDRPIMTGNDGHLWFFKERPIFLEKHPFRTYLTSRALLYTHDARGLRERVQKTLNLP